MNGFFGCVCLVDLLVRRLGIFQGEDSGGFFFEGWVLVGFVYVFR